MGNSIAGEVMSTVATAPRIPIVASAAAISTVPTSFVYEDLVSHVQAIQQQIIEFIKLLDDRQKYEKNIKSELKSRSLIFTDPYGNPTINTYMDHEILGTIVRKYKEEYVPKYLQKWIKIGTMHKNVIRPLSDYDLKVDVSMFADGHRFVTYGEVTVWRGIYGNLSSKMDELPVLLTDNMEKVKMQLIAEQKVTDMELRSFIMNGNTPPTSDNWNEGKILNSTDTILSCQLYQENSIIMEQHIKVKINCTFFLLLIMHDFVFSTDSFYKTP